QWRALLDRFGLLDTPVITHESLSVHPYRPLPSLTVPYRLFVVDEAHRFRNPDTNRYRNLARLVVGSRVLLVTATPVHNRIADLLHLLRLFLRDHALAALGVPSLRGAARERADATLASAATSRLSSPDHATGCSTATPQDHLPSHFRVSAAPRCERDRRPIP